MPKTAQDIPAIVQATQRWVERAVIGLNLCPFAKAVHVKGLIRYHVSLAEDEDQLLADLREELLRLAQCPATQIDTTVLVHPNVGEDFLHFNDFLDRAEACLAELDLEGVLQIASFHPQYQFAGTSAQDIENFTNRSPFASLHLIREDSIERAVAHYPDPDRIYEHNIQTLHALGHEGWQALWSRSEPES